MKKKNKIELNCCGEDNCDCQKSADDSVEVYVCPKCRSVEVEFVFTLRNFFGIIPRMRCNKCFFEGAVFPKWKISKKAIVAFEKEKKKKSKRASYKDEIKEIYCPNCKDVVQIEMKDGSIDSFVCKNCKFEIKREK